MRVAWHIDREVTVDKLIQWQARPVFITSTFRDMHAERDYLNSHVFPELEERLRERFTHLEPIDLRIGVETVSTDEQHAKELLVLKVCLAEVKRSRPFLIALLGDRYGWVPPEERMIAAAQEAGFDQPVAGRSVTDLEIDYGVLDKSEQEQRSFFYFRAPLPYDKMPPAIAAEYSERHNPDPKARAAAEQLSNLKQRIVDRVPDRVRHYTAQWDSDRQCVTGLEAWGQQVVEDLWPELKTETAAHAQQGEISWQQAERLNLEQFIEDRSLDFTGRESILNELEQFATAPDKADSLPGMATNTDWGRCLTGPAGAGKSAVFAQLYRRFQTGNQLMLAHAAGTSPRSSNIDDMLRAWIDELATKLNIENPLPDDAKPEDIEQQFRMLLGRAGDTQRVVILVDALNQFEATNRGRYLSWLPPIWPANVRFIATAIPGDETNALKQREGIEALALEAMQREEAEQIVKTIYSRYHREVNREVQAELLSKKQATGEPAYGNPLWLHLATEHLNQLDADDFARAEQDFAGTPEQRQHQLILRLIEEMPTDVPALYSWMLNRAEKTFGENWTRAFVNLIAVSRAGWREIDLKVMMPIVSGQTWDDLQFAVLRRFFRGHICQRGVYNQCDFTHVQLRKSVVKRNLEDTKNTRNLHDRIANYLFTIPRDDPLHESETMFHLYEADNRARTAQYYGGWLTSAEKLGASSVLAELILQGEKQSVTNNDANNNPGLAWTESLLHADKSKASQRGIICNRYIFELNGLLEPHTVLSTRFGLIRFTTATLQALIDAAPDNAQWQRDLSFCHEKIGEIRQAQGDLAGALAAFEWSLAIAKQMADQYPRDAQWQRDLSVSQERIGDILHAQGDLSGALAAYQRNLAINDQLSGQESSKTQWQEQPAFPLYKIGDVLRQKGELRNSISAHERSLAIFKKLVDKDAANTGYQRGLVANYDKIAENYQIQGDLGGALTACERSLQITTELSNQDPGDTRLQRDLSVSFDRIGTTRKAQGILVEALTAFQKSLAIRQQLSKLDPSNTDWQRDLTLSRNQIGAIFQMQGNLDEALTAYDSGMEIRQQLADQDPSNLRWQWDLSSSFHLRGDVLRSQANLDSALSAFENSLAIRKRLANQHPENTRWQLGLSDSYNEIGKSRQAMGDIVGAITAFESSRDLATQFAAQNSANAECQLTLAASMFAIGGIRQLQGNMDSAYTAYKESEVITKLLSDQNPDNAEYQQKLAVCFERIGAIHRAQNDLDGALSFFERNLTICQRLAKRAPGNVEWQQNLADALDEISTIYSKQANWDGALTAFKRALAIREQLTHRHPDHAELQRSLSITLNKIGTFYREQGDLGSALHAYEESKTLCKQLAEQHPGNADLQFNLSVSYERIGTVRQTQGDLPGALTAFEWSLTICNRLADDNPGNHQWQRWVSMSYDYIGAIHRAQGDLRNALTAFDKSLLIRQQQVNKNPGDVQRQRDLSQSYEYVADIMESQGDLSGAKSAIEQNLAIAKQLAKRSQDNADLQTDLARSCYNMSDLTNQLSNPDEARNYRSNCYSILQRMEDAGMHIDKTMANIYEQLKQEFNH